MAGRLVHFELPARDSGRAKEFYGALFGWRFQSYGDQDYHMTQFDEQSGGAISGGEEGSAPRIYFDVDDIDSALAKVRELGGQGDDKQPVPGMGWFAACTDTEGTSFSIWQTDESAPPPEGASYGRAITLSVSTGQSRRTRGQSPRVLTSAPPSRRLWR